MFGKKKVVPAPIIDYSSKSFVDRLTTFEVSIMKYEPLTAQQKYELKSFFLDNRGFTEILFDEANNEVVAIDWDDPDVFTCRYNMNEAYLFSAGLIKIIPEKTRLYKLS